MEIIIIAAIVAYALFTLDKYDILKDFCTPCKAFWISLLITEGKWAYDAMFAPVFHFDIWICLNAFVSGAVAVIFKRYME